MTGSAADGARPPGQPAALDERGSLDELACGRLRGKVVIITGAGRGIGRAAARRIAAAGGRGVVAGVCGESAHRRAAKIGAAGGQARVLVAALRDYSACARLAADVSEQAGQIDVLINNVGGATDLKPFLSGTPEA